MKCQLCEGPIVNGRCSLCGMPFRSDAVLYHPNERPSEHYKHANAKSRAVMRRQHDAAGSAILGKNATKSDIKAYQDQVRRDAVKRMTATKTVAHTDKSTAKQHVNTKKKRTVNIFLTIFIIFIILTNFLPRVLDEILERSYSSSYSDIDTYTYTDTDSSEESVYDLYFYEGGYDDTSYYMLAAGKGSVTVGKEIDPGTYSIWTAEDSVTLILKNDGSTREYDLEIGSENLTLDLESGSQLSLTNAKNDESAIYLDHVSASNT